jgi:putative acetyltransferase
MVMPARIKIMTIRLAQHAEFEAIAAVWEDSVRATHHFLSEKDICAMRPQLLAHWLPAVTVTVYVAAHGIAGFMGTHGGKLEMLFVAPSWRGHGIGMALLRHAISALSVTHVDVNEQNPAAQGFYVHAGFEVIGRSPLDGQGNPYPLLHMRLARGLGMAVV